MRHVVAAALLVTAEREVLDAAVDLPGTLMRAMLAASTTPGVARFRVRSDGGVRAVLLTPATALEVTS